MKYLIVDDEALARRGIERYGARIERLEHVGSCENALEAATVLKQTAVDLLILDIHMPRLTGIEFLKAQTQLPLVILHTAYTNYALEGFELDVIDYLVKPTTFDRFEKAIGKAHDYYQFKLNGQKITEDREFVFIRCNGQHEKIDFNHLLYVEAMQNYSVFYTTDGKFVSLMSLRAVGEILPPDRFYRTHKSYLVNLNKIERIDGSVLVVCGKRLPLGRAQRKTLLS